VILVISAALLVLGGVFWGTAFGCWLLIASELLLFARFIREPVSGLGSFVFMSVMFFALRPIYILLHHDYGLLQHLFRVAPDIAMVHRNSFWSALGLSAFVLGGLVLRGVLTRNLAAGFLAERAAGIVRVPAFSDNLANVLLTSQVVSWILMKGIAAAGTGLYGSALGAYMYDLPAVIHGGQIACLMIFLERLIQRRTNAGMYFAASALLFITFTFLMRDVSVFRGFYLAGLMIGGIAVAARVRRRVGYAWLIVPIIIALPLFRALGEMRYEERETIGQTVASRSAEIFRPESYWRFFDSRGDMNIFDSFIAASEANPNRRPYVLSWLYVPVHLVPRKLWPGKPERGVLQDHSFSHGAPYSPGIAGYFVLDGGRVWMVACMALLGSVVALLDLLAMRTRIDWLRSTIYAVFVINAMFLTRFLLWQYAYQVLYMLLPILALAWFTQSHVRTMRVQRGILDTGAVAAT
jgi:hypothetical protein